MQDRERILELVKKGVLSTEEALVLLESMAVEKDTKQIQKVADQVSEKKNLFERPVTPRTPVAPVPPVSPEHPVDAEKAQDVHDVEQAARDAAQAAADGAQATKDAEQAGKDAEQAAKDAEQAAKDAEQATKDAEQAAKDKAEREKELAELAEKANAASAELDNVNEEIVKLTEDIKVKLEAKQVYDTMEELGTLTESKVAERKDVLDALNQLEDSLSLAKICQSELEQELKGINKKRFNFAKERISQKFEIPEDWKTQTKETFEQVGGKVQDASTQLGGFFKKTFNSVMDAVNDNVDWKDVNIKMPGIATTKFSHTFNYPEVNASIIDIKLANGRVEFKESDTTDLKVEADIKLYGKMDAETPLQAFLEKSQIDVDDDIISFQIPNKRVKADLVFYLPKRVYDHVSLKLLNGDIKSGALQAKDVFAKSTNGEINFSNSEASMLEINGVNGDIIVSDSKLIDLAIESVNGDITFKNTVLSSASAKLVNGDIRATMTDGGFTTLSATSVNGDVKVAIPASVGLDGHAQTTLGTVQQRLSNVEVTSAQGANATVHNYSFDASSKKGKQVIAFQRLNENGVAKVDVKTTTGNIYLKDTEQK